MHLREILAAVVGATLLSCSALAQTQQQPLPTAIKGYDAVGYFTQSRPVRGSPDFTQDWDGLRYQFASRAHRDAFAADPDRYAPQYSGHCTAAMSRGVKIEAEPESWVISGGRLFVFARVMPPERWAAEREEIIVNADRRWAELKKPAN